MKKFLLFIISIPGVYASSAFAQTSNESLSKPNEIDFSAQIRTRGEYRNGQGTLREEGATPATFINYRTRFSVAYKHSNYLEIKLAAQNTGVWGDGAQIDKTKALSLNEAWTKFTPEGKDFYLQVGRQTLAYDDERILGALDWHVNGRFHDALKLGYEKNNHKIHGVFAYNQNSEKTTGNYYQSSEVPTQSMDYKALELIWYNYTKKSFSGSLLFLNIHRQGGTAEEPTNGNLQTFGTFLKNNVGGVRLTGSFYYQTGKSAQDVKTSAYLWNVNGAYSFNPIIDVNVGVENISGNDDSDKTTAFNTLYGTHHKFNGTMDYFTFPAYKNNKGLWDLNIGTKVNVSKKVSLKGAYHYFATDKKVKDQGRTLGSEFDIDVDWKIAPYVTVQGGYSTFFGTKTLAAVKNGGSRGSWQDWAFLSLNINPKLFSAKW